jgi:hypothetical protein
MVKVSPWEGVVGLVDLEMRHHVTFTCCFWLRGACTKLIM